ncbi:MAG: serine/threonine-protein kinase [Nannocystaceae bacterium]
MSSPSTPLNRQGARGRSRSASEGTASEAETIEGVPQDRGSSSTGERRGQLLGRYVLLEPIGRGGMGVVYSAYDPELDRRVALKLLHANSSERGNARLLREAQAMAKLVHPNVITVHDVGSFDGGVFLAMELVEGTDLRRWLDRSPRSLAEILEVFAAAGRGLLAAHEAGLVHRDFKPANVLVGRRGEVKVVDFGLARQLEPGGDTEQVRALAAELGLDSSGGHSLGEPSSRAVSAAAEPGKSLTRTGALMGTPAYMAPEQHARRTLDARADQFSFCVALYEALFGQSPFEGDNRFALAMATNRGEIRPLPKGHAIPSRLQRAVLRGLSARPRDRFDSMSELLAELSYDPGRRRRGVLAGLGAAGLLAVGIYGYARPPAAEPSPCSEAGHALEGTWDEPQRAALRQAFAASELPYASDTARSVVERLDGWSEQWTQSRHHACEQTRVHRQQPEAVLQLRNECLERQRKDLAAVVQLLVEAGPETIARSDRMLTSLPAPAACDDGESLGRLPPPADAATRRTVQVIDERMSEIRALRAAGRYDEALSQAKAVRVEAEQTGHLPTIAELLVLMGNLHNHGIDQDEGEHLLHTAAQTAAEARHDEALAAAWLELAWAVGMGRSRYDEGLRWASYAEAVVNRMGRPDHMRINLLRTQGSLLWAKHDHAAALEHLQAGLDHLEANDPSSPDVPIILTTIGNVQIDLAEPEAAQATFERAQELTTALYGAEHPMVASTYVGLGVAHYHQHRLEQSERAYQRAYEINLKILGPDHPDLLYSLGNIANLRREQGQLEAALVAMRDVQTLVDRAFPPEHRETATTLHNMAELLALLERHDEALDHYDRALALRISVLGEDSPYVANTLTGRGEVRLALQHDEQAREDLERALGIRERAKTPHPHDIGRTRFALGRALDRLGVQPLRARELVAAARRDFEEVGSTQQQQQREQMDAWLREHPDPGGR